MTNDFKCKNDFYLRTPVLSYDFYKKNLLGISSLKIENISYKYIENILTSSYNLYNSLVNNINSKNKTLNLYKYLLRSSIRTTPYGLNTSVVQGSFDKKSYYILGENKKKVRVDIEWIISVIKLIENELGKDLKIITNNNNFVIRKNYVFKIVDSCFVKEERKLSDVCRINYTGLISKIFKLCDNEYISIKEVLLYLEKYYPNQNDKIFNVIQDLLGNEFLVSNLRVNLLNLNSLKSLINILQVNNYSTHRLLSLIEIDKLIDEYMNININCGEIKYLEIRSKMEKISKVENYLQIDTYNCSKIILDQQMKSDLEDFSNFIMTYTCNETYFEYVKKYKEKYGNQAVKLTDVLDENNGLGYPKSDSKNTVKNTEKMLLVLLNQLMTNDSNVIDLSKGVLKQNLEKNMYSSFELSFFILNTEKGYEYILSPMMGSENKWKSFGRFDYLFNNSLIKKDKSGNDLSKKVEITFYPKEAHNSNVCICNHNKNAFLEFNTRNTTSIEESIPINDIYMFIDENDKIIFLQKSTRQILSFETTNKYITTLFPPMLKVLMDVCKNQNNSLESFLVQILNLSKKLKGHTPEIRYKNFVILPETWRINKDDLFKNNNFVSFKYFDKYVDKLIFANLLPEVIYTGELDRKLILNLNYLIDKKILYDMLKKDSSLLIYKNIFSSNELLLTDKNCEKYIGEFVFQFENDFIYDKSLDYLRKRISFLDYENQYEHSSFAFDNWTTILLYVEKQDENRILINQIYEMYTYFKRKNIIINFFFIRYKDPCSHLRLRFKVNKEHKNDFISNIHDFVSTLKKYKILNDVKYVTYIPEINRYGGNNSIEKAEELFEYNSLQVLEILKLIQNKKTKLNINQIFLMLSYKIIRDMNISDSEIIEYLQGYKFSKKINSNLLKEIEDYFYNNFNLKSFERKNEQMLYKIFNSSTSINYEYWKTICNEYDNDKIKESYIKKHCIISILHMLHNRLIGIDSENETLLMGLLEKMIYTKKQREKYYISK